MLDMERMTWSNVCLGHVLILAFKVRYLLELSKEVKGRRQETHEDEIWLRVSLSRPSHPSSAEHFADRIQYGNYFRYRNDAAASSLQLFNFYLLTRVLEDRTTGRNYNRISSFLPLNHPHQVRISCLTLL